MNCCGNKRKAWQNEVRSSQHRETISNDSNALMADKTERLFEYTGDSSLTVKGIASGKAYSFRFKGDKLAVDYFDSFALMAERDLKVLPR
ncbi:MAG: hypothetical protein ACXVB0_10105 [Mucilaginibacter sp.]